MPVEIDSYLPIKNKERFREHFDTLLGRKFPSDKIVLVIQKALVTGSCGLIGSEVCEHLGGRGFRVSGIDNNERAVFFGPEGDTSW